MTKTDFRPTVLVDCESAGFSMPTLRNPTLEQLREAIVEFNQRYPRPNIPSLHISSPFELSLIHRIDWPNSGLPGIYAFLSQDSFVIYIGKASCGRTLRDRVRDHFRIGPDDKLVPLVDGKGKAESATHGITIGIPKVQWFEAAAIEEYLLSKLLPPHNTLGLRGDGSSYWNYLFSLGGESEN